MSIFAGQKIHYCLDGVLKFAIHKIFNHIIPNGSMLKEKQVYSTIRLKSISIDAVWVINYRKVFSNWSK